jgi:hypothetical protein
MPYDCILLTHFYIQACTYVRIIPLLDTGFKTKQQAYEYGECLQTAK